MYAIPCHDHQDEIDISLFDSYHWRCALRYYYYSFGFVINQILSQQSFSYLLSFSLRLTLSQHIEISLPSLSMFFFSHFPISIDSKNFCFPFPTVFCIHKTNTENSFLTACISASFQLLFKCGACNYTEVVSKCY